jgi:hypothetical protein
LKKGLVLVMVLALLVVAATANAQVFGKGKTQFSFGLTQFVGHTIDTLLFGDNDNPIPFDDHLLGFGVSFKHGIAQHWAVDAGGFFGFGNTKWELGTFEEKYKVSAFGFRAGLDYTENIGDMFGIYMGPGLEFVSARSSGEVNIVPPLDEDNDKTTTLSFDGRIGVQAKLGRNFGLNANLGQKWSRNSASYDTDLGGPALEEVKVSRWVSSMNGFAGFVIYVN